MILRLFIEKKKEYDTRARRLLFLLHRDVKLERSVDIRVFTRYDISGVAAEHFERIKYDLLASTDADNIFPDYLPLTNEWKTIALAYPVGQFSQEEEYIRRALKLCSVPAGCKIAMSTVFAFGEDIKSSQLEELRALLIAPGYELPVEADRSLGVTKSAKGAKSAKPASHGEVEDFIKMNDIDIYQFRRTAGFKMSSADLCALRDYYKERERNPQLLELMALDGCRAERSSEQSTQFADIQIKDAPLNLPIKITLEEYLIARRELYGERGGAPCLEDIPKLGLLQLRQRGLAGDLERDERGELQINLPADINGVYDQWLLRFGCMRQDADSSREYDCDGEIVGEMLSSKLSCYQALHLDCDSSGGARRAIDNTKYEQAQSRFYSQNGVATLASNVVFSDYDKTHLEFGAAVAAAPRANMLRSAAAVGDSIFMLGGRIGRGDHSAAIGERFIQRCRPEVRARISALFRNAAAALMIKRVCDARQGLFNAITRLAGGVGGAVIDFDRVLDGSGDIASVISSANERVLVLCDKDNRERFAALCEESGVPAEVIAMTASDPIYRIYGKGRELAKLDAQLLQVRRNPPVTDVIIDEPSEPRLTRGVAEELNNLPLTEAFLRNLALHSAGEYQLSDLQYDWSVGAATVQAPFGGKMQSSPEEAMICKIPADGKITNTVTAISYGCAQEITAVSPFHGAAFSIMQAISKIVASGANSLSVKLAISQSMRAAGELPSKWGKPVGAMLGAYAASIGMGLPIVDSDVAVQNDDSAPSPFALCCFALSATKTNEIITSAFKGVGSSVLLIPMPTITKTGMPDFDRARVMYRQLHYLSQSGKVLSASVVKGGGVAAAVAKMSFGNNYGVKFSVSDRKILFSGMSASILVETNSPGAFSGMDTIKIGTTTVEDCFDFAGATISIKNAFSAAKSSAERGFSRFSSVKVPMTNITLNRTRQLERSCPAVARPSVLIPAFGGELGDNETAYCFENAGGAVQRMFFDYSHLEQSKAQLAKTIAAAQILVLTDGADGRLSTNLPVYALSDARVAEALLEFLQRDGLILGVGRGFDALLRLRLFDIKEAYPMLLPNILGKTVSQLVTTRITSCRSPWFAGCEAGDSYTTALHCSSGRLVASEQAIYRLSKGGQIASQYVDFKRQPSGKQQFNPAGAVCAIEGLSNLTGRILGLMGHDERYTGGCFSNVSGRKNRHIFESGINYFK